MEKLLEDLNAAILILLKGWKPMEAATINRKLKELDQLEERVRQTVNPSAILLAQIREEREELLNPKPEEHK